MKKRWVVLGLVLLVGLLFIGCSDSPGSSAGQYTLTIEIEGQGVVEPASGSKFSRDTIVSLTVIPEQNWEFDFWDGPDGGEVVDNKIIMSRDRHLIAVFREDNKVARPEISPAGGSYHAPQQVTITCATTGADIYYTTDGSIPSKNSGMQYSGPFQLEKCAEVKAVAIKDGFLDSEVATAILTLTESKIVFTSNRDGTEEIYVMNADGSSQLRLTDNTTDDRYPAWSPDGSKIAFVSAREGDPEIYVMNADGSNQTKLTDNGVGDGNPAWSPDGNRIAFSSERDGNYEIYIMNADGSSQQRLTNTAADEYRLTWSPDGNKIAFDSKRDGTYEIYIMNTDGSNQVRITASPADNQDPDWSADGSKLLFMSYLEGNFEIYVMDVDGSNQLQLTDSSAWEYDPCWSLVGNRIVYSSDIDGDYEIYTMDADGSSSVWLTNNQATDYAPDWGEIPLY